MDVSLAADLSAKHLSYIETGRAGLAPPHRERPFADLGIAKDAVHAVLTGMDPNPAVAVNVRWDLLAMNPAMRPFLSDLPEDVAGPPVNMLRATLHPDGLAGLLAELESYGTAAPSGNSAPAGDLVVPLQLTTPYGDLDFLYGATVFGSPRDVTLDEIAIETFFPANAQTAAVLRSLADNRLHVELHVERSSGMVRA
ncbi:MAG TPA: transcriptional regulator [Kribbella sp.]|nr:transcriptional regulator [Kribbella sp.]